LDKTIQNEGKGMTYCQGKLYLRKKTIKEFGRLVVIDPITFEIEGEI